MKFNAKTCGDMPELPDDFSPSKDWACGNYADRVELLLMLVAALREEIARQAEDTDTLPPANTQKTLKAPSDHIEIRFKGCVAKDASEYMVALSKLMRVSARWATVGNDTKAVI